MQRWDRLVEEFVEEYVARGVGETRVQQVRRELDLWGSWMKRRRPRPRLEALWEDLDLLVRFIGDRNAFRSKSTVRSNMSCMRLMGEFLVGRGLWRRNPLRWMSGPRRDPRSPLPRRLGKAELERIWGAASEHRMGYYRHLAVTVLALLYGTGIRRGELYRLDLEHWEGESGTLRVDGRKTGRERRVPVPEVVWRYVESYLPARHNVLERWGRLEEPALLVSGEGQRMSEAGLSRLVHRCADRAGVALWSMHQFRHSCASDLLEAGRSLPEIKDLLGHAVIETTVRYLHVADPQLREAAERHPLNGWLGAGAGEGGR